MSSGMKREQINTRERAVSTDINRLQSFIGAEVMQAWYEVAAKRLQASDVTPGTESSPAAAANPPFSAVLNGLRAYPVNGTIDMLVTPGVMMMENPAAGVDDCPLLYVNDPGVTAIGVLQMTAGAGTPRIDVIEVQPVDTVLESDNRDIFNIVTGLFAPAMVTKVACTRLTYRIRTGVAGAGFPGTVAGWVPIAVALVPAGAGTWDACDIWDVRTLVSEYWNAPFKEGVTNSTMEYSHLVAEEMNAAPDYQVQVTGRAVGKHGYNKVGGTFTNYPTGAAYVDITTTTTNWAAGYVIAAGSPWHLYLAFPGGLPGWRKYCSSATSPRVPTGTRGIPVVCQTAPGFDRRPGVAIAMPTSTGLGTTTTDAIAVATGATSLAGKMRGFASNGVDFWLKEQLYKAALASDPLGAGSTYQLVSGTEYPRYATALKLRLVVTLSGAAPPANPIPSTLIPVIKLRNKAGTLVAAYVWRGTVGTGIDAAGSSTWEVPFEVPMLPDSGTTTLEVTFLIASSGYVYTVVGMDRVYYDGWKLASP